MIRISVVRNGHWAEDYMRSTVNTVLNMKGIVVKKLYGIIGNNADEICTIFEYVQRAYGKNLFVPVHCFIVDFDDDLCFEAMVKAADHVMSFFINKFQTLYIIRDNGYGHYQAVFVINSISYVDGKCFHDNNAMYITLRQYLNGMFGQEIRFEVAENVFFDNQESNRNCYKDLPAE